MLLWHIELGAALIPTDAVLWSLLLWCFDPCCGAASRTGWGSSCWRRTLRTGRRGQTSQAWRGWQERTSPSSKETTWTPAPSSWCSAILSWRWEHSLTTDPRPLNPGSFPLPTCSLCSSGCSLACVWGQSDGDPDGPLHRWLPGLQRDTLPPGLSEATGEEPTRSAASGASVLAEQMCDECDAFVQIFRARSGCLCGFVVRRWRFTPSSSSSVFSSPQVVFVDGNGLFHYRGNQNCLGFDSSILHRWTRSLTCPT